jgi:hypothetical protein
MRCLVESLMQLNVGIGDGDASHIDTTLSGAAPLKKVPSYTLEVLLAPMPFRRPLLIAVHEQVIHEWHCSIQTRAATKVC